MAGAAFGDLGVQLFVAGEVFGDLGMSLFVAGAVFGDLGASFFLAGAAFGDLGVSLFVAGAVFGEIWVDSRSAKCCNFQYKMRCRGGKSKLCERAGSVLQFHARIMFGSCSNRPRIVNDTSTVFGQFLLDFGMQFCVAGAVFGEVEGRCLLLRAL